jgi:uncharacterized coiled-coil protein SlyX
MLKRLLKAYLQSDQNELEYRVANLEQGVLRLCDVLTEQLQKVDYNTKMLDKNMRSMATAIIDRSGPFPGQSFN